MGLRNILKSNDVMLRKKCREVIEFDARLHRLVDDMIETMRNADGAGLAAPQIGVLRRVCIVEITGDKEIAPIELINPRVVSSRGKLNGAEGCLSVPNRTGLVSRPKKIIIEAQNRYGEPFTMAAEDLEARALCHEIDHLDGRLYIDIMERFLTQEEIEELERDG